LCQQPVFPAEQIRRTIMTEQLERLVGPAETLEIAHRAEQTTQAAVGTPVLITESEVAFRTAAAVPLRPAAKGWRTQASRVALAVRRTVAGLIADERPEPRRHPRRLWYLEDPRMAREMGRL
jgi:hypothetical protein